jgi:mono/diheme cytochrome c family protein
MSFVRCFSLFTTLVGAYGCARDAPPPAPAPPVIVQTPDVQAFKEKCAMCHGPGGMGTIVLARRMAPALAPLEARSDLDAAYVRQTVRGGIGNMPRLSRAEVSDADLSAIATYLAKR